METSGFFFEKTDMMKRSALPHFAKSMAIYCALLSGFLHAELSQPIAPVRPVTEIYFGTEVTDNYRYFEDLKSPEVQAWMHTQADYTRATLDRIPGRQALLARIHELSNADVSRGGFIRRGDRYFYMRVNVLEIT